MNREKIINKLSSLVLELIIVFVGVYAAFLLDDFKTQKRNEKRRNQIYQSLYEEIFQGSSSMNTSFGMLDSLVFTPYLTSYDKGLMPTLKPLFIGSANYSTRKWEAILSTGGIEILNLEMIEEMEEYYFQVHLLIEQMKKMESLCIQQLLPNLEKERTEFYNLQTKKLKEKYYWYIQTLSSMQELTKKIVIKNKKLLESLKIKIS